MSCPISGVSFSLEPAYPNTTPHTTTPPHYAGLRADIFTTNNTINSSSPSSFVVVVYVLVAAATNVKWIIYRKSNGLITGRARRR